MKDATIAPEIPGLLWGTKNADMEKQDYTPCFFPGLFLL